MFNLGECLLCSVLQPARVTVPFLTEGAAAEPCIALGVCKAPCDLQPPLALLPRCTGELCAPADLGLSPTPALPAAGV